MAEVVEELDYGGVMWLMGCLCLGLCLACLNLRQHFHFQLSRQFGFGLRARGHRGASRDQAKKAKAGTSAKCENMAHSRRMIPEDR